MNWIGSPNFDEGRQGYKPEAIVIHVIEGTLGSADSWFASKVSKVSAHYGIGKNREIHQYVKEEDTAQHAGKIVRPTWRALKRGVNPNLYTIGIEHEGTSTSAWPDTMYEDSARLVRQIALRWGIPIDRDHVVGHREIRADKTCPGAGDVDLIVCMAVTHPAVMYGTAATRALKRGDRGQDVQTLQLALVRHSVLTPKAMTTGPGVFGPKTEAAVREFQRRAGLEVDSIVGPATWEALGVNS